MSGINRSGDIRLNLSLDDIIELERQKNEKNRRSNIAALCKVEDVPMEISPEDEQKPLEREHTDNEEHTEDKKSIALHSSKTVIQRTITVRNFKNNRNRNSNQKFNNYEPSHNYKNNLFQRNKRTATSQERFPPHSNKRKHGITHKQRTYLQQLRRLRTVQGFHTGRHQQYIRRFKTSTPNGSLIFPLTRNMLRQFDFFNPARPTLSLLDLAAASSAGGRSCHSFCTRRSSCSFYQRRSGSQKSYRSNRSFRSERINRKSFLNPRIAGEIAQIQSSFEGQPNFNDAFKANRKPIKNFKNCTTEVPLTSRFRSYYIPKK